MGIVRFLCILAVVIGFSWVLGWYVGTYKPVLFRSTTPLVPTTMPEIHTATPSAK